MNSLWWFGLPVLLLPIWWHRKKRERASTLPLATARFLPRTDPLQRRVWRWTDRILLLLRCLLLATAIAWLADPVVPWRGDSVLVAPGADSGWTEKQIGQAGFAGKARIALAGPDAFGWLARHEGEWRPDARLLVVGSVAMPAAKPVFRHEVLVRSGAANGPRAERHVAIASQRPQKWRALFDAVDGPYRYVVDAQPGRATELIVWDLPDTPPAALRAPLWWIGDATAFPELRKARTLDRLRIADSPRGRLWASDDWPAADADAARVQFETWQRLHYPPVPYLAPGMTLAASASASNAYAGGALRGLLAYALLALFALERMVAHASRR